MVKFVLIILLIARRGVALMTSNEDERVSRLVKAWAPLVWLAPGERFMPLGVPEFLEHVQAGDNYLRTRIDILTLLKNESSFLYGKRPSSTNVPIYALVKNCWNPSNSTSSSSDDKQNNDSIKVRDNDTRHYHQRKKRMKKNNNKVHFHVTYWMFYPFSEGKAVCVLDLGIFGTWPIPIIAGNICLGKLKEYGNHVGDWEHMSLYFKGENYPLAMYVSAHDAGAFYRYETKTGSFVYESQETRKGIFQKPIFPEHVFTSGKSHPVLFSAKGSHGLWTAPGKHKFVRLPRLYDESGFGTPWPSWQQLELLLGDNTSITPSWMSFRGKWGNPQTNCHPLVKLGFNICEFVDGPAGIPMKKGSFQC